MARTGATCAGSNVTRYVSDLPNSTNSPSSLGGIFLIAFCIATSGWDQGKFLID